MHPTVVFITPGTEGGGENARTPGRNKEQVLCGTKIIKYCGASEMSFERENPGSRGKGGRWLDKVYWIH